MLIDSPLSAYFDDIIPQQPALSNDSKQRQPALGDFTSLIQSPHLTSRRRRYIMQSPHLLLRPHLSEILLRGRLLLRFQCAVWMCCEPSAAVTRVFDVQQNSRPITLNAANIAASSAARRRAAQMRRHAARSAACVFENSGQKTGWKNKMTSKTHTALHAARRAARRAAWRAARVLRL
jgi:hypothetical protein